MRRDRENQAEPARRERMTPIWTRSAYLHTGPRQLKCRTRETGHTTAPDRIGPDQAKKTACIQGGVHTRLGGRGDKRGAERGVAGTTGASDTSLNEMCACGSPLAGEDGRGPHGVTGLCRASPAAALNAADDTNGGVGAAASAGAERGAGGSLPGIGRDGDRGVLLHRSSSSLSFALPAAALPAAGPCFARIARGRGGARRRRRGSRT